MLISQAFAQDTTATTSAPGGADAAPAANPAQAFTMNIGMVAVLVLMFYVLLIRPQQKRFKDHSTMLSGLQKGDKVITGGGLVGTIADIPGNDEIVIDLGNNMKVTALRSTIHGKDSALMRKPPLNDKKAAKADTAKK